MGHMGLVLPQIIFFELANNLRERPTPTPAVRTVPIHTWSSPSWSAVWLKGWGELVNAELQTLELPEPWVLDLDVGGLVGRVGDLEGEQVKDHPHFRIRTQTHFWTHFQMSQGTNIDEAEDEAEDEAVDGKSDDMDQLPDLKQGKNAKQRQVEQLKQIKQRKLLYKSPHRNPIYKIKGYKPPKYPNYPQGWQKARCNTRPNRLEKFNFKDRWGS